MKQTEMNLQTRPMAHHDDPEASYIAAQGHVTRGNAVSNRYTVLRAIRRWPDCTADELAANLAVQSDKPGLDAIEIRRRRTELASAGLIKKTGQRICWAKGTLQTTWGVKP